MARNKPLVQIMLFLGRTRSVGTRRLINSPKGIDSCLRVMMAREEALRRSNITLNSHVARVVNKREECVMVKARPLHDECFDPTYPFYDRRMSLLESRCVPDILALEAHDQDMIEHFRRRLLKLREHRMHTIAQYCSRHIHILTPSVVW